MGLFSKRITVVDTTVVPLFDEITPQRSVADSVLRAILMDAPISDSLVDFRISQPSFKIDRMYEYAKTDYPFGLPESLVATQGEHDDLVSPILQEILGKPVRLQYTHLGSGDPTHMAFVRLQNDYGYDHYSNEIHGLSDSMGYTVFLEAVDVVVDTSELSNHELSHVNAYLNGNTGSRLPGYSQMKTSEIGRWVRVRDRGGVDGTGGTTTWTFYVNPNRIPYTVTVRYLYETDGGIEHGSMVWPLTWFDRDVDYMQAMVRYEEDVPDPDDPEVVRKEVRSFYWSYEKGSEVHPTIDALYHYTFGNPGNTFLPFIFFVRGRTNRTASQFQDTDEYKASAKMLKYLGLDYRMLGEQIMANPDSNLLEQAALMFGMPVHKEEEDPLVIAYLFEFWKRQYDRLPTAQRLVAKVGDTWVQRQRGRVQSAAIIVQDADFTMSYGYSKIERSIKTGSPREPGTYRQSHTSEPVKLVVIHEQSFGEGEYEYTVKEVTQNVPVLVYRKQLTTTVYEEVRVFNLSQHYYVIGNRGEAATIDDDRMLIPVDKKLMDLFSEVDQDYLYKRSMHFVFNSRDTVKLKWYQTGFFRAVVTIAAIVITIKTGIDLYTAAATAFAQGGITAAAFVVLEAIVLSQVFALAFAEIVSAIGLDAALAALLAAVAVTVFQGVTEGGATSLPSAADMLKVVNGIASGIESFLKDAINDLKEQWELLREEHNQAEAEIQEALRLLEPGTILDPFATFIGRPVEFFGESSESYYTRSLITNPGPLALDAVSNFVAASLTLPTIHQSTEDAL